MSEELIDGETNVLRDLTKKNWRNVASAVVWHGRGTTIGMAELLVRSALAYFDKPQTGENRDDFARLENRNARHSVDNDGLRADEFGLELRFAVVKQHGDHFSKIGLQLVE